MRTESRRHFLKTCLRLAQAGCGIPIFTLCRGCSDERRSKGPVKPGASSRDHRLAANPNPDFKPAYARLHRSGELKARGEGLWGRMRRCDLCPRECGAKRSQGMTTRYPTRLPVRKHPERRGTGIEIEQELVAHSGVQMPPVRSGWDLRANRPF